MPSLPYLDYAPLGSAESERIDRMFADSSASKPKYAPGYSKNVSSLDDALAQYDHQDKAFNGPPAPHRKGPMWQRALGNIMEIVEPVLKYSSLAEDVAPALRAVGARGAASKYEDALNYIPGVRSAADIMTNPLTYVPIPGIGGGTGALGMQALAKAGAMAVGSGIAENAFTPTSQRGMGLSMPLIPDQYEPLVANIAGGIAGAGGLERVMQHGLPGTTSPNAELAAMGKGIGASSDTKIVARNWDKLEQGYVKKGINPNTQMYTNDGGATAQVKPFPQVADSEKYIGLKPEELVPPAGAAEAPQKAGHSYVALSTEEAQAAAESGLSKDAPHVIRDTPVDPQLYGGTVARVSDDHIVFDKDTNTPLGLKRDVDPGDLMVLTSATGETPTWQPVVGLAKKARPVERFTPAEAGGIENWRLEPKTRRWINVAREKEALKAGMTPKAAAQAAEVNPIVAEAAAGAPAEAAPPPVTPTEPVTAPAPPLEQPIPAEQTQPAEGANALSPHLNSSFTPTKLETFNDQGVTITEAHFDVAGHQIVVGSVKDQITLDFRRTGAEPGFGRRPGGNLTDIREVGRFVDDLAAANPDKAIIISGADARLSSVYQRLGFKSFGDSSGTLLEYDRSAPALVEARGTPIQPTAEVPQPIQTPVAAVPDVSAPSAVVQGHSAGIPHADVIARIDKLPPVYEPVLENMREAQSHGMTSAEYMSALSPADQQRVTQLASFLGTDSVDSAYAAVAEHQGRLPGSLAKSVEGEPTGEGTGMRSFSQEDLANKTTTPTKDLISLHGSLPRGKLLETMPGAAHEREMLDGALRQRALNGDVEAQAYVLKIDGKLSSPDSSVTNTQIAQKWNRAEYNGNREQMSLLEQTLLQRANAGDEEARGLYELKQALPNDHPDYVEPTAKPTAEAQPLAQSGTPAPPHPDFLPEKMTPEQAQKLIDSGILSPSEQKVAQAWIDGEVPGTMQRSGKKPSALIYERETTDPSGMTTRSQTRLNANGSASVRKIYTDANGESFTTGWQGTPARYTSPEKYIADQKAAGFRSAQDPRGPGSGDPVTQAARDALTATGDGEVPGALNFTRLGEKTPVTELQAGFKTTYPVAGDLGGRNGRAAFMLDSGHNINVERISPTTFSIDFKRLGDDIEGYGRKAGGSVRNLNEVGHFLQDLIANNPNIQFIATAADNRLRDAYLRMGFDRMFPEELDSLSLVLNSEKLDATMQRFRQVAPLSDALQSKPRVIVPVDAVPEGVEPGVKSKNFDQPSGAPVRGTAIAHDDPRIPDVLYHATTNAPGVQKDGMLLAGGVGGLGGDARDQVVSFTTDKGIATQLVSDLKLSSQVARLDVAGADSATLVKVLSQQAEKEGWSKQWQELLENYGWDTKPHEGYNAKDWLRQYFTYRAYNTKMRNPLIFTNVEDLARIKPENVSLVVVPKGTLPKNALITDFDLGSKFGLGEIRVYGDVPVSGMTHIGDALYDSTLAARQSVDTHPLQIGLEKTITQAKVDGTVAIPDISDWSVNNHKAPWEALANDINVSSYAKPLQQTFDSVLKDASEALQSSLYATSHPTYDSSLLTVGSGVYASAAKDTVIVDPLMLWNRARVVAGEGASREQLLQAFSKEVTDTLWHEQVHSVLTHAATGADDSVFENALMEIRKNPELLQKSTDQMLATVKQLEDTGAIGELEQHAQQHATNIINVSRRFNGQPELPGSTELTGDVLGGAKQAGTSGDGIAGVHPSVDKHGALNPSDTAGGSQAGVRPVGEGTSAGEPGLAPAADVRQSIADIPDLKASSTWMRPDGTFVQNAEANSTHSALAAKEGFNGGRNDYGEFGPANNQASDAGYVRVRAWNSGGNAPIAQLGIAGNSDESIAKAAQAYIDAGVPRDTPTRVDGPKGSRFDLGTGEPTPKTLGEVAGGGISDQLQQRSALRGLPDPERLPPALASIKRDAASPATADDALSALKKAVYNADEPAKFGTPAEPAGIKLVKRAQVKPTDAILPKPSSSGRLVERQQPITGTVNQLFKEDNGRKAADFLAQSKVGKMIVGKIGGLAAVAKSPVDQHIVAYFARAEADSTNLTQAMSNLIGRRPFDMYESMGIKDLTMVKTWRGEDVVAPLHDVLMMPDRFKLTSSQQAWVDIYHDITTQLVDNAKASGVSLKDLGLEQIGQYYVPRQVLGIMDLDKPGNYVRGALGVKQGFQQQRYYHTAADGIANGVHYADSGDALFQLGLGTQKAARDAELVAALKPFGRTGKELAGPEVQAVRDAEAANLRKARAASVLADRVVGKEKLTWVTNKATAKAGAMSPDEIKAAIERDPGVVDAQSSRDMAQTALEKAQSRLNQVKTDKAKGVWTQKVQDAADELNNRTDELTQARTDARTTLEQIDAGQRDFHSDRGNLTTAEATAKEANDKLIQAKISARDTQLSTGRVIKAAGKTMKGELGDFTQEQADVIAAQNELRAAKMMRAGDGEKAARIEEAQSALDDALDARAKVDPNAALDLSGDIVNVRQVRELPGLQGRLFPDEMADNLEKYLAQSKGSKLSTLSKYNDLMRTTEASTDFGHVLIQGLPVLGRNPVAWSKAAYTAIRAFADPDYLQQLYRNNPEIIAKWGPYFGQLSSNEYYQSVREGIIGAGMKSNVPLISGTAHTVGRFSVSFDGFLDASRIELAKAFDKAGQSPQELEDLGRLIRNMTGTTSTGRLGVSTAQRQTEALLMFSPRFTRSVWALGAQALEAGTAGNEARRTIAQMIGGGMLLYTAAYMATNNGELPSPESFNPTSGGKFMSIKVGDNYIGIGGTMRGAIQFLGYAMQASLHLDRLASLETGPTGNPFLTFARGRSSPLTGSVWNYASGKSVIGDDTSTLGKWMNSLPNNLLPFALSSWTEANGGWHQKLGVLAAQSVGLRTYPEAISQSFNDQMQQDLSKMTDTPGFSKQDLQGVNIWGDLSSYQKATVLAANPDLLKMLTKKEQENWNNYTQVRQQTTVAKEALGREFIAGQKAIAEGRVPDPSKGEMAPKAYRDALKTLDDQRRGALNMVSGGNVFSGDGSNAIAVAPTSYRNRLMAQYHAAIDAANPIDPVTGMMDFSALDIAEQTFLQAQSPGDREIIAQEQGSSADAVERQFKAAKVAMRDYWDINDQVAQKIGFKNAEDVTINGTKGQQSRYATLRTQAQERFRRQNRDIDQLLVDWGYSSASVFNRKSGGSTTALSPSRIKSVPNPKSVRKVA